MLVQNGSWTRNLEIRSLTRYLLRHLDMVVFNFTCERAMGGRDCVSFMVSVGIEPTHIFM